MQESVETIKAELEDRLKFEELLSNISSKFMNISPDRVDPEINHSLKKIFEFFPVDRVGMLQVLPSRSSFRITHEAYVKGLQPFPVGEEAPQSLYPWSFDKVIRERKVLSLHRLDDLPAEASVDRQSYTRTGVRSTLDIPIFFTVGRVSKRRRM